MNLAEYDSDLDSDYSPSELSEDSMEYDSGEETIHEIYDVEEMIRISSA